MLWHVLVVSLRIHRHTWSEKWNLLCVIQDRANISLSSAASASFIINISLWCLPSILPVCLLKKPWVAKAGVINSLLGSYKLYLHRNMSKGKEEKKKKQLCIWIVMNALLYTRRKRHMEVLDCNSITISCLEFFF